MSYSGDGQFFKVLKIGLWRNQSKRQGENLLEIAQRVKQLLDDYRERLPSHIALTVTSDTSKHSEFMVRDLENNMITGLILVVA